ncbi:MAG: helix-turn-helix transcriptional regulator [Pseudomonadales bacterium]|nr:helix-turn-helix transcriptional regulator [Pseudomonadales bacterium]
MKKGLSKYTVSVETLISHHKAVEQFLRDRGDYEVLLDALFFKIQALEGFDPQERIAIDVVANNIDTVAGWLNEPNLGLKVSPYSSRRQKRLGFFFQENNLPLFDYFRLLARYVCISSEVMRVAVIPERNRLKLAIAPNCPRHVSLHQTEGFIASVRDLVKESRKIEPLEIGFSHSNPNGYDHQIYQQTLGIVPKFNQADNFIIYASDSSQLMFERFPSGSGIRSIQSMEALKRSEVGTDCWAERSRFLLEILMCYGEPKKDVLAELLTVSPRTLQRRLEDEGETFRSLLNNLRKERATTYLSDKERTVEEIAFLLGYLDVGHFFRAFKVWYGISPGQFRQKQMN